MTKHLFMDKNFVPIISLLDKPKPIEPGTYDAKWNMLKSWDSLIADNDITVANYENGSAVLSIPHANKPSRFIGVSKIIVDDSITHLMNTSRQYKIPGTNNYTYEYYGTFENIPELTEVVLPEGLQRIEQRAFYGCDLIKELNIPESVITIAERSFEGCSALERLKGLGSNNLYGFSKSVLEGCSELDEYIDLSNNSRINSFDERCFFGCSKIDVKFSDSIKYNVRMRAFSGCKKLSRIPERMSYVYGGAFSGCSGITDIYIKEDTFFTQDLVVSYINWFEGCNLETITVDPAHKEYDSRDNCNAIIFKSDNTLRVGCKNTTIPDTVATIYSNAFKGCEGLIDMTIPEHITGIGTSAFANCPDLETIAIPGSVTTIQPYTFEKSVKLKDVTISEGVQTISRWAFLNCVDLKEITIPDSVTSIDETAFRGCSNLTTIHYSGTASGVPWGAENATVVP